MYLFNIILSFLRDKEYRQLLGVTAIILAIGTITYHYLEGWSWIDALYFFHHYINHHRLWRFLSPNHGGEAIYHSIYYCWYWHDFRLY